MTQVRTLDTIPKHAASSDMFSCGSNCSVQYVEQMYNSVIELLGILSKYFSKSETGCASWIEVNQKTEVNQELKLRAQRFLLSPKRVAHPESYLFSSSEKRKIFFGQSIQKIFCFILEKEALVVYSSARALIRAPIAARTVARSLASPGGSDSWVVVWTDNEDERATGQAAY